MRSYGICLSLTGLLHLAQRPLVPPMLWQTAGFHSAPWLSSLPLCVCTSTDGRFGCFRVLAIADNAVNIGMHVSFQISVWLSSDKYPEVELLGYTIVQFLIF